MSESQTPAVPAADPPKPPPPLVPHIGAFVLETLTLGMYGEPRHTLREYVQNAFDSIRAARRLKVLNTRGVVTITLAEDSIKIHDNGLGVSQSQAWRTLTSVGASKKDRQRDAGFRGIGRLAGMAYCKTLSFATTFAGETAKTTLSFDCEKLLKAMDPDAGGDMELAKLLASAITHEVDAAGAKEDEHFFEVLMEGLEGAPETLKDTAEITKYLSETVPVAFDPSWARAADIEQSYRAFFGEPMETIDVFVDAGGSKAQIFKAYGDEYGFAKGTTQLAKIEFQLDAAGRYWGWVGHLSESAAVTDWSTRGLRMRVRNIQIDGTQLFEKLFTDVKPSYGRFSSFYVGEIHVAPESVVPNARRDSFEETSAWLEIRRDLLKQVCEPLASEAYKASEDAQTEITKVVAKVDDLVEKGRRLTENSNASYDQVVDLLNSAKRLRRNTATALKVVGDVDDTMSEVEGPNGAPSPKKAFAALQEASRNVEAIESQARMMIGRYIDEDEKVAALRSRIREELLEQMLEIVNAYVDPPTYQAIRRRLMALS
jgi:molecular chaperone HtpG